MTSARCRLLRYPASSATFPLVANKIETLDKTSMSAFVIVDVISLADACEQYRMRIKARRACSGSRRSTARHADGFAKSKVVADLVSDWMYVSTLPDSVSILQVREAEIETHALSFS